MIRFLFLMFLLISCERYEDVNLYNSVDYAINSGKLFYKGELFSGKLKIVEDETVKLIEYKNGLEHGRYLEIYKNGETAKDLTYNKGKPFSRVL